MAGPTLFKLGDTPITLAGGSFGIDNMTTIGTSIITNASSGNLTLSSGTSHHFLSAGSEKMRINQDGNVGIATTDPTSILTVKSDININTGSNFANRIAPFYVEHSNGEGIMIDNNQIEGAGTHISCNYNSAENWAMCYGGGRVGVGVTPGAPTTDFYVSGTTWSTTGWSSSDDRIKYNEQIIVPSEALSLINQLTPQKYEKIIHYPSSDETYEPGTWMPTDAEWPNVKDEWRWNLEAGLIAQEVKAIPELAYTVFGEEVDEYDNQTVLGLNYSDIAMYHIAATKELSTQLETEKVKVANLETELAAIKTHLGL